jgi:hypothetical protein
MQRSGVVKCCIEGSGSITMVKRSLAFALQQQCHRHAQ